MNIALIGYGRMGKEIEDVALKRGHSISLIIDLHNTEDLNPAKLKQADIAIEFSSPESAFDNISKCLRMGTPVVSGTTGWLEKYDLAAEICKKSGTSFIHATNFSIGVNLFFKLNEHFSRMMEVHEEYLPEIEEIHHVKKLDAPSGTAITLANGIIASNSRFRKWTPDNQAEETAISVKSVREGVVPGTHTITWNSEIDSISLRHVAKNRRGLALGAVMAAEYISNRMGVFTMDDVLGF